MSVECSQASALASGIHFISAIDTDAGKTVCTGWLARELLRAGRRTATMKLVQTGCGDCSPDIALHRRIMGVDLPEDETGLTAPALFNYPASPHLAASLEGRTLDLKRIVECARTLAQSYEVVLVEGAGGLAVPLTPDLLTIDFVNENGWPFVFVTSGRLGSISHTLLSFEALQSRRAEISAVIYNRFCALPDPLIEQDARKYLYADAHRRFPEALWLECPVFDPAKLAAKPSESFS